MRFFISSFLLIILFTSAFGQTFKASGKIEKPERDGFYKVFLSPKEAAYLSDNLANVRILDSKNAEVPYLLREEEPVFLQQEFKEYNILSKQQIPGKQTIIKLHNPKNVSINNISLLIKNAEVQKRARLTGGDDEKEWYVVKNDFTFNPISNPNTVAEIRAIEFPLTNYTYYKLELEDSTSGPLNILKAGYYTVSATNGLFTAITDSISITSSQKGKQTYLKLQFKSEQIVDKVELSMTGTTFFQRTVTVSTEREITVKKRKQIYHEAITSFIIRSGKPAIVNLNGIRTNHLTFVIDNGDNPALSIQELKAYQLNRYLVAWLKKNEAYTVAFREKDLTAPDYDLEYFRDSIPQQMQVLKINDIQSAATTPQTRETTFFTDKTIIWIALGAVIALLGFMSLRLVRETNSNKNN